MAYVTHRQGLYRTGFRPIQTNAWAATQLGKTPFDFDLWRLGQVRPITPGGGYGLHGLGDIVPANAVVEYRGSWNVAISGISPDTVLAEVVAALQQEGFHVLTSSQSGGLLGTVFTGKFTVDIQMQVTNDGYSSPSDVAAIVDHEAYLATGNLPLGSSVSVLSTSGTPGAGLPPAGLPAGLIPTVPSNWNAWLQENALWIGLAVVGAFVVPPLLEKF